MSNERFFQFELTWFLETLSLGAAAERPLSIDEFEELAVALWNASKLSE